MTNQPESPGMPPVSWSTGVTDGTLPVGYIPATNEVAGISPVFVGGDADPGGRDTVAATAAEAVSNAEARFAEHQADTYGQGSVIGDILTLPPVPDNAVPAANSDLYPWSGLEPTPAGAGFEYSGDEPQPR